MITILSGSQKKQAPSNSMKVASYMQDYLSNRGENAQVVSLAQLEIPFWEENVAAHPEAYPDWHALSQQLSNSDAFVFILPEYGGMAPTKLKNVLQLCDKQPAYKPTLLIGISASFGGTNPLAEFRMSGYKNTKISYLPDQIVLRHCNNIFAENPGKFEIELLDRIKKTLDVLVVYKEAFKNIRSHPSVVNFPYPFGM